MKNNYMIGSGYCEFPGSFWFSKLWHQNLPPGPVVIMCVGGATPAVSSNDATRIELQGNCGHVHALIGKQEPAKPHALCGWSASVLALAMIAYNDERDFCYIEQDALLFGDCIGQMYRELGDGKMIFGRKMQSAPWMPCAQSLFLIKHEWIPEFVSQYLSYGNDRNQANLPEHKYVKLLERNPRTVKQFSFGFDRERPLDISLPIWYAQKFTGEELLLLRKAGLIHFDGQPPAGLFTSQA